MSDNVVQWLEDWESDTPTTEKEDRAAYLLQHQRQEIEALRACLEAEQTVNHQHQGEIGRHMREAADLKRERDEARELLDDLAKRAPEEYQKSMNWLGGFDRS